MTEAHKWIKNQIPRARDNSEKRKPLKWENNNKQRKWNCFETGRNEKCVLKKKIAPITEQKHTAADALMLLP